MSDDVQGAYKPGFVEKFLLVVIRQLIGATFFVLTALMWSFIFGVDIWSFSRNEQFILLMCLLVATIGCAPKD